MKKYLLAFILLLLSVSVFTQTKPKPKEKPPTQKEMSDMMQEMQKSMNGMSPEDTKLLNGTGVKIPDIKSAKKTVSGISDGQINKGMDDGSRIVPKKDLARIAIATSRTINDEEMPAYIGKIHSQITGKLHPEYKERADEIVQLITQNNNAPNAIGQAAVAVLTEEKPMLALYLLGIACKKSASADDLNNYAAVLTSLGAEPLAIPILNNLNKHYPQNSTIYNNLGQAWFGLGDMEKANKFIDSAIRIYAFHPQANFTKCLIEESKGNTTGAIEAAKRSIKKGFSIAKANKLDKLGYQLKSDDVDWDAPMPKDELGLSKFRWPAYPKNVEDSKVLEPLWAIFKEECNAKISELQSQQAMLEKEMTDQQQLRKAALLDASQTGSGATPLPEMAYKAFVKLAPMVKGIDAVNNYVFASELTPVINANATIDDLQRIESEELSVFHKKYDDQFGEGKPNPFEAACKDENTIRNKFLNDANTLMEQKERVYLNYVSRQTDNLLYYRKYTQWPDEYAWTTVAAQISWLTQISRQIVSFRNANENCKYADKEEESKQDSLQNFDDVACKYISTTDLGCFTITSKCSHLIGEFNCGGIEIKMKKNDETERFSGSVFVGASKSVSVGKGPVSAELEATAAVGVEVGENGKTDLVGKLGGNINVAGQNVAGVEARAGVNSGPSLTGNGALQGLDVR
ncbi:hypothetical protein QWZ08_08055 [Ferruginibacter paludis]|uniref:tetratricopeptide repeat protein n=1 Tax=Ferruginibacter paludis TaxID=1310417 RepID=UPI0025B4D3F3|nr:hypothetical protein [Ferruginibacter paludis]MDN3655575.1 hypothetical protein [Ferruginibacter paludis]